MAVQPLDRVLASAGVTPEGYAGADAAGVLVASVHQDSRRVGPGDVFCAVRGAHVDGHDRAAAACEAGAVAVVVERPIDLPASVAQIVVADVRSAVGPLAAAAHGHPSEAMRVVGITGTNGKTTSAHLAQAVFTAAGWRTEVIGTLTGAPGAPPTTPDAPDLQATLAGFRDRGVDAVAMEVSSHGLEARRVDGTRFVATMFTNLSQDHLDLHGTMEAYFNAKARLFTPVFSDLAVVNLDDVHGRLLRDAATVETIGYSVDDVEDLRLERSGSSFVWQATQLRVPLAGLHNVSNALGVATVARALGVPLDAIADGLASAPPVRGRFERVDAGQPFEVVVDYAHTPDALEQVLGAARAVSGSGRVLVVFGAGGDRDPDKRPVMGAVATRLADEVVITSDNPRSEDPSVIAEAIRGGTAGPTRVRVVLDRAAAIALALGEAREGDIVVIAGKGHETTQTAGAEVRPFDDREVAAAALLELGHRGREDRAP